MIIKQQDLTLTKADLADLASRAEADHRAANERFQEAKTASEMASFRQVVFTAATAGVTAVNLEASDQGDHMSLTNVVPEELDDSDLDNALWDGVSDLADYTSCDWAGQPGVTTTISHRDDQIMSATIDIKVAAEALLATPSDPAPESPMTHVDFAREWLKADDSPDADSDSLYTSARWEFERVVKENEGVRVVVHRSGGSDGAVVVQIDTEFEPDASDGGPGLRVNVNDGDAFVGVPYAPVDDGEEDDQRLIRKYDSN